MPYDANAILQASVTKTASFQGAGVSLRNPSSTTGTALGGTPRRGLWAHVNYSAASNASGANTVYWTIDVADDNATFTTIATSETQLALSTTAASGELALKFETDKPWVRLSVVVSGAGTVPTVTYSGQIAIARP